MNQETIVTGFVKLVDGQINEIVRGRSSAPLGFIPIHTVMDTGFDNTIHAPDKSNLTYELHDGYLLEIVGFKVRNLEIAKRESLEKLAMKRWQVETGGFLWNGLLVDTDRESQAKLHAAFQLATNGLWPPGAGWKFKNESRELTPNELTDLAISVGLFVQGCYTIERELADKVEAATTIAGIKWRWPD